MAKIEDNRTAEQRESLPFGVAMTHALDRSVHIWACPSRWIAHVGGAVRRRKDARRVRIVDLRTYLRSCTAARIHVYVVDAAHRYSPVRVEDFQRANFARGLYGPAGGEL